MRVHSLAFVLLLAAAPLAAASPQPVGPAPEPDREPVRLADPGPADEPAGLERHCLRETGTRIRIRSERRPCAPYSGRVWTREELDRTGEVDLASALRRLDVSIR